MRCRAQQNRVRGATLIEVMMILVIVGLLAALAGPRMSDAIRSSQEPAEVELVRQTLLKARNLARRTNRCIQVTIVDGRTLTIAEHNVTTPAVCNKVSLGITAETVRFNPDLITLETTVGNVTPSGSVLTFSPTGGTIHTGVIAEISARTKVRNLRKKFSVLPKLGTLRVGS